MSILEFIAKSEWPIVAIVALLLFRGPLASLMKRANLTKIEAWGIKAEFEKGLEKVEVLTPPKEQAKAEELVRLRTRDSVTFRTGYAEGFLPFLYENASPEAMVLDTWSRVEADMRAMMDALHPRDDVHRSFPLRLQEAAKELGLSGDEVESLLVLRNLRNKIAHSAERSLSWDDAARFKRSAERLLLTMKKNWEELRKK